MRTKSKTNVLRFRRPYGSLVVETNISYHNQRPDAGVIVRQRYLDRRSGKVIDKSKYFTVYRHGSMSTAIWHAIRWKNAELRTIIKRRKIAS